MTDREIIKRIDEGANFYLSLLGDAKHMEFYKGDFYSHIFPKQGEKGVKFLFDIKLDDLPEKEQIEKVSEIKSLNAHIWWSLTDSDKLYRLINGKDREKQVPPPGSGAELYTKDT